MGSKRSKAPVGIKGDLSLNDPLRGLRLSAAMTARGLKHNCQICYDLGVTESSLSRWRSGGPLSISMAVNLARLLGVSVDWLVTGSEAVSDLQNCMGREHQEIVMLFSALSPSDRELLLKLSEALLYAHGPAARDQKIDPALGMFTPAQR